MKIQKIAIEISKKSFLPEAYAYQDFLLEKGFHCELVTKENDAKNFDAIILFHGFHPFWRKFPPLIIGEYHSLSTGRLSRLKDFIKRIFNKKAHFYIFLNEKVRQKLWVSKKTSYAIRPMGYPKQEYETLKLKYKDNKQFDIVYAGSFREGIIEVLENLAKFNLKIIVVGFFHQNSLTSNIIYMGPQDVSVARQIISKSNYGLNYTPDVFPFNIQDSTKVIEYCGAGLKIITNKYKWVTDFEKEHSAHFLDLKDIKSSEDITSFNYITPQIDHLDWNNLCSIVFNSIISAKTAGEIIK